MNRKNVSIDLILDYLSTVYGSKPIRIIELSRLHIKNQVFYVQTESNRIVLKIYLDENKERRASNEWEALNRLSRQFQFVLKPFLYDPNPPILPGPVLINPYVDGIEFKDEIRGSKFCEENWLKLMKHVIELIQKVHSLGSVTITDYNEYLKQKFNLHFKTEDYSTLKKLAYEPCIDLYLSKRESIVPETLTICHGDLGTHQIIMQNGSVSSIIDWEDYGPNDPALDIGYLTFSAVRDYFPDTEKVHKCILLIKTMTRLKNLEFFIAERAIGTILLEFAEMTPGNRKMILDFINELL